MRKKELKMAIGPKQNEQFAQLVNRLKPYLDTIKNFVPLPQKEQRWLVTGVINFLERGNFLDAVEKNNHVFKDAIGFTGVPNMEFDEKRLEKLVMNIVEAAEKQKQMSTAQILTEMRKYQDYVREQEQKEQNMQAIIWHLSGIQRSTLWDAADKIKLTHRKTKQQFKNASDILNKIINDTDLSEMGNLDTEKLRQLIEGTLRPDDLTTILAAQAIQRNS